MRTLLPEPAAIFMWVLSGRCVPENRPHQTDHGGAGDSRHLRPYRKERARDELPQSGSGKTIMTSEPKFVPEEAVEISPDGVTKLRVRLIDSVGYMVDGAVGAEEDGVPRMVTTPW